MKGALLMAALLVSPSLPTGGAEEGLISKTHKIERRYSLPRGLLVSMVTLESRGNPLAVTKHDGKGRRTSYGLMQIQKPAAKTVGFIDNPLTLLNAETNLIVGAQYFNWVLKGVAKNNVGMALTCYNAGPYSTKCKSGVRSGYGWHVLKAMRKL